jgi:hypothetical protein
MPGLCFKCLPGGSIHAAVPPIALSKRWDTEASARLARPQFLHTDFTEAVREALPEDLVPGRITAGGHGASGQDRRVRAPLLRPSTGRAPLPPEHPGRPLQVVHPIGGRAPSRCTDGAQRRHTTPPGLFGHFGRDKTIGSRPPVK